MRLRDDGYGAGVSVTIKANCGLHAAMASAASSEVVGVPLSSLITVLDSKSDHARCHSESCARRIR